MPSLDLPPRLVVDLCAIGGVGLAGLPETEPLESLLASEKCRFSFCIFEFVSVGS